MPTTLRAASFAAAESRPTASTTQAPKSSVVQSLRARVCVPVGAYREDGRGGKWS